MCIREAAKLSCLRRLSPWDRGGSGEPPQQEGPKENKTDLSEGELVSYLPIFFLSKNGKRDLVYPTVTFALNLK